MMTQTEAKTLNPKFQKQLNLLDKKLNLLLEELKDYSEDQLNRKPAEDKWSVIQVMHHLLLAETGSYNYVNKKLSFNPVLKKTGIMTWFRRTLMKFFLRTPIKFKAPKGVGSEFLPDRAGFWDTAKLWKEQRVKLKEFLATLPEERLKQEVYKHPMAGRQGLNGMFDFFDLHFDRHHKQIRKIVKHYPKQN